MPYNPNENESVQSNPDGKKTASARPAQSSAKGKKKVNSLGGYQKGKSAAAPRTSGAPKPKSAASRRRSRAIRRKLYSIPPQARGVVLGVCVLGLVAVSARLFLWVFPSELPWEKDPVVAEDVAAETEPEVVENPAFVGDYASSLPSTSITAMVNAMSTEAKIAQLFLVECTMDDATTFIEDYQPAGVMLVSENFDGATVGSALNFTSSLQVEASIPLLVAINEEGGDETVISQYKDFRSWPFQTPRELYASGGYGYIETDTAEKSRLLKSVGVNVNLAPVADVAVDSSDYMYSRSFGSSATDVASYVEYVVDQMEKNGMGSVLKHFPGYGNNPDNSNGPVIDNRTMTELTESDLIPFAVGIETGADAVLMTHNVVAAMDSEVPASLSSPVINYLRERMGFEGVVIADVLTVPAVESVYESGAAAVKAVQAGNDLIIVEADEYITQYVAIQEAYESGFIDAVSLDESVTRVLTWKYDLGLISVETLTEELEIDVSDTTIVAETEEAQTEA